MDDRRPGGRACRLLATVAIVAALAGCTDDPPTVVAGPTTTRPAAGAEGAPASPPAASPPSPSPSPSPAVSPADLPTGGGTLGAFAVSGRFPASVGAEVSGVAGGREVTGIWLVDDQPGTDEVHLVALDGTGVATVTMRGASTVNPEDLAVGPCPGEPARSCVHVADIGDNVGAREDVVVWSFPESAAADGGAVDVDPSVRRLRYDAGPVDAEALAVATDGTILLVDKAPDVAGVHVARDDESVLRRIGGIELPEPALPFFELVVGRVVTAADLRPDDGALLLRTYDDVLELTAPGGGRLDPAVVPDAEIVQLPGPGDVQGEAIAYLDGGARVVAVAEGSAAIRVAERVTAAAAR